MSAESLEACLIRMWGGTTYVGQYYIYGVVQPIDSPQVVGWNPSIDHFLNMFFDTRLHFSFLIAEKLLAFDTIQDF